MWQLLKNAQIYSPERREETDLLIVGHKIAAIGHNLYRPDYADGIDIDLNGLILVPGFVDGHIHICGGGGEDGPSSRTPEIQLSQITQSGITTVVGLLGTDSVSKSMRQLLIKAQALEEEGVSTYIYSGAYQLPFETLFAGLKEDLVLVPKVIGAGEIALSDHRSAQPQLAELERLAAEARVGGLLGKKAGIVHFHMGEGKRGLQALRDILQHTEIPITQFIPTHINRTFSLLEEGIQFLQAGGHIDLTAGCDDLPEELKVPHVLQILNQRKLLNERVTISSDANGSMPQYDEKGNIIGMNVGKTEVLWNDVRTAVLDYNIPLEQGLKPITSNVADFLSLPHKGRIQLGNDADLVVLDQDYNIQHVWAKGQWMVKNQFPIVWGRFESKPV